jgi:hypothetical protein
MRVRRHGGDSDIEAGCEPVTIILSNAFGGHLKFMLAAHPVFICASPSRRKPHTWLRVHDLTRLNQEQMSFNSMEGEHLIIRVD